MWKCQTFRINKKCYCVWRKNWRNFKNFYRQFWKCFKKNLEVLENFNKMYTIMYAFHCFSKKNTTLIVYITEFFLKSGGPNALLPPPRVKSGGPWPPDPPVADPMHYQSPFLTSTYLEYSSTFLLKYSCMHVFEYF